MRIYLRFLIPVATVLAVLMPTGDLSAAPAARTATSPDCYSAINVWWPVSSRAWARKIVTREAGNRPSAANARSSARGCWQLLMSLHAHRYNKVGFGCHPGKWANADCNTLAALHLFRQAGTRPWAVTRYTR
jgi:hypothetical protein